MSALSSPQPTMRPPLLHSRSNTPQQPQSRPPSLSRPLVFPPTESRPIISPPESRPIDASPLQPRPIISPPPESRPVVFPPPESRPIISSPPESRPIVLPPPEQTSDSSWPSQSRSVESTTSSIGPVLSPDFELPPPIDATASWSSVMRIHPFSSFNPGPDAEPPSIPNTDQPMTEASSVDDAMKDFQETMQAIVELGSSNATNVEGGEIKDLEMSCINYSPEKHLN